jgi:prolipoprotein diacylglyceryl transferase
MIIIGIIVSVWVGERRWTARGGTPGTIIDLAVWAVPFGLVGGRLYHVITDGGRLYFGKGENWVDAFKIWDGGLGIWGAIALGALGVYIGCRRNGIAMRPIADALAPGIVFAQAIGRWGNWWNQELYGKPLHTFWALKIDMAHRPRLSDNSLDPKYVNVTTYQPTFLYESLWCLGVGILVIWAGKRYRLNWGRSFALYVAAYTVGRAWIEWLRIDTAHQYLGLRLNDYTAIVVCLCAAAYLYAYRDKGGAEEVLEPGRVKAAGETGEAAEAGGETEGETAEEEAPRISEPVSNVRIVENEEEEGAEEAASGTEPSQTPEASAAEEADESPSPAGDEAESDSETVNGAK